MKLLVQRDEQIQIGAEIFMTPLYGCSEDAEFGMPIKYVFKREKCCCHAPSTLSLAFVLYIYTETTILLKLY